MPGAAGIDDNQVDAVIAVIFVKLIQTFADLQVPMQLIDEHLLARSVHLQPLFPKYVPIVPGDKAGRSRGGAVGEGGGSVAAFPPRLAFPAYLDCLHRRAFCPS